MGTWGTGILEDDTALDIHGDFIERFDDGESPDAARQAVIRRYYDQFLDEETNAAVWLGLAQAEWDVGALQPVTLQTIEQIVATGQDLARWAGPDRDQRQAVLQAFVKALRTPRETPRVPTPIVAKPAVAQPGTCFAVKLLDGQGWGEPPRILRRLQHLRRWSHEQVTEVLPGSARARRAHGAGAPSRLPVAVGSH